MDEDPPRQAGQVRVRKEGFFPPNYLDDSRVIKMRTDASYVLLARELVSASTWHFAGEEQ